VTVVGHSFGAIVALRFALDHPALVERVVVAEAPLPITVATSAEVLAAEATHASDREALAPTREFIEKTVQESVEAGLATLAPAHREAFRAKGRRGRRVASRVAALVDETSILDDLVAEPDIPDRELATLARPVLLAYGTRTLPVMSATCARLAMILPDARVRRFDAGHFLTREVPLEFAAAIREFIDG
jgi:pimeloyl-ACP methyl ester carboxylesterase